MVNTNKTNEFTQFPKTFMLLLASEAIGGEERYFMELAIAMQYSSTKPIVINLKTKTPYESELIKHGVFFKSGIMQSPFALSNSYSLLHLFQKLSPDVLLINGNRLALWVGSILGRLCHIPIILIHTHTHMGLYSLSLRFTSLLVDGIIAAATSHRLQLCTKYKLKKDKVTTVYPGIDLSRIAIIDNKNKDDKNISDIKPKMIAIIAALRPEKDHETFIQAAGIIRQKIPDTMFYIIGDGPRRFELEKLACKIGIKDSLFFLGWQKIDGNLLHQIDILVLSSVSETFPAVIIEALGSGIPIVATEVGSVKELLGSTSCGLLVPPRNPDSLANAVIRCIQDNKLVEEMTKNGQTRSNFFTAERFCDDILQLSRQRFLAKKSFIIN
jgi:glycosyltransferase involved in cell wall biosynthesis